MANEDWKSSAWVKRCEKAAAKVEVAVTFYPDDVRDKNNYFEDDGSLHICKAGYPRACFDVGAGRSLSNATQNRRTMEVMTKLGLGPYIGKPVLADETEDNDGFCCPGCGRSY